MDAPIRRVHFVGIKGKGMSALALICKEAGITVTGSDVAEQFATDAALAAAGITVWSGFKSSHLGKRPDVVVATAFGSEENPEIRTAQRFSIPVMTHLELLQKLVAGRPLIAVAGTHGKTTTTALVATLLHAHRLDPGYFIGEARVFKPLVAPGHAGTGPMVVEADEYRSSSQDPTPKFLYLKPSIAVILNIDYEHPDRYKTLDELYDAYFRFATRVQRGGMIIAGIDSPRARRLRTSLVDRRFETFGYAPDADWRITHQALTPQGHSFSIQEKGQRRGPFVLGISGRHNVSNATAAIAVARQFDVSWETITRTLTQFAGLARRFEVIGRFGGFTLIDDYAHHPTELRALIETAHNRFPQQRIWVAFQPHTYSRTEALLDEFIQALGSADALFILPTFASARELPRSPDPSQEVIKRLRAARKTVLACNLEDLPAEAREHLSTNDVLVCAGAGSIAQAPELFRKEFQ